MGGVIEGCSSWDLRNSKGGEGVAWSRQMLSAPVIAILAANTLTDDRKAVWDMGLSTDSRGEGGRGSRADRRSRQTERVREKYRKRERNKGDGEQREGENTSLWVGSSRALRKEALQYSLAA